MVSAPTTLKRLNDAQLAIAESHPDWRKYGGKCPTCEDTGSFVYGGNTYPCPDDDYGHTRTRLFAQYLAANIPEQYQVLQWSEYPHWEVREAVDAYLENFESFYHHGMGMEFLSRAQAVGKTWAATHILREVVKRSYKGWFVDFAQMKGYAELEDREERIWKTRMVRETPVLVIDDVRKPWSEASRSFFADKLEEVVRERTNNNLVTLITSNLEEAEMEKHFPRVFSLLQAKTHDRLILSGADAREGIAWETNEALSMMGERRPVT